MNRHNNKPRIPNMIDLTALDTELRSALTTLEGQTGAVAQARAFKAGESDSRKQALHGVQAGLIIQGDSVAASEVKARATAAYSTFANSSAAALLTAEEVIAENDVAWAKFNALRELVKAAAATAAVANS